MDIVRIPLSVEVEVFEDLTKPNSDRYQFVYPNINFFKNINSQKYTWFF